MIHICPVEISAAFMVYRDIVINHGSFLLRWFTACCAKCCTHKKEDYGPPPKL